ncbi:MAG: hypothetical protein UX02_C0004G0083 [Candidatus Moranbacteria bacterium GW2011_GWC1_45_18]|nr:MAG: hypothetical protein UT79_C0003G0006 [Candidatus Moranbacteria bacterium GW2011_GWC2_40_12]KKT33971.1 MAG: hypothetical protein UW19_C0003G0006 [Candidatus Moranbacteria bacterium GW2011_GWF2_44_10]KKT99363.1 MAG: hypothetical protein UX02_C0004G0083 [Candidatus Moranbacteria bacterium GW2011_GWC1_45_18]OGI23287.1 MAG: hypothetical protein A2194_01770 [Candidatus Moranbacteria bacterium RIFOXYA1_FULL_44_8]OGI36764.1 MAG: hypothetical protein A2407_03275 [Candidatus Moranbacteria bacteri
MSNTKKIESIIIANPEEFKRKKEAIRRGGAEKLHVLADFDRTLTYSMINGERKPSLIAILRREKYLTPDYPSKAHALKDKYRPLEFDLSVPLAERKVAMHEWWTKHFELFRESRLNKRDIEKAITSESVQLRKGVKEFLKRLRDLRIPFVVMSAAGLGGEAVEMFFKKEGISLENIHLVANSFKWDAEGYMVGANEPIIHSLNKDETAIQQFPVYEEIKKRKNVLLLGDGTGDAGMSDGFDAENVLKIGFLNEKAEENLKHYTKLYDVVLLNDPPFDYIVELLKEIV